MNVKRYLAATVATFVFIFGFEYLWHGQLLSGFYEATPSLWRPKTEMGKFLPLIPIYQIALAAVITFFFTRNYEGKGIGEGLRFGCLIGGLIGILSASFYIYLPVQKALAAGWLVGGFLVGLGSGVVSSLVYRR